MVICLVLYAYLHVLDPVHSLPWNGFITPAIMKCIPSELRNESIIRCDHLQDRTVGMIVEIQDYALLLRNNSNTPIAPNRTAFGSGMAV